MNIRYLRYNKPAKEKGLFDRGDRKSQSLRYRQKYSYKISAHNAVYRALKRGLLIKKTICQICGNSTLTLAHHNNYSKWLDILWVCQICHNDIHKILKERSVISG